MLKDFILLKDAEGVTGYSHASLLTYAGLSTDFPAPAHLIGRIRLYRPADLAAWAKRRRKKVKRRKAA